jgi:magnesium chelatase accessory protein
MDWQAHRHDWPHAERSRFVEAGGVRWHVQQAGQQGPKVLLIHGTGASGHTWRDLLWPLAQHAQVWVVDLPGHGFSSLAAGQGMSMSGMAVSLNALMQKLGVAVDIFIGHSAGAAIAARMVVDHSLRPQALIGINPAWLPLPGLAGLLFPPTAKLLSLTSYVPQWFAKQASSPGMLDKLLEGTGSVLDDKGKSLYAKLVADPEHAQGALKMMAAWDLTVGPCMLRQLRCPVHILVGDNDRAVPPAQAQQALALLSDGHLERWAGYGHLVHEEAPMKCVAFLHELASSLRSSP